MAMKSLDRQLNVPIYYKATGIDIQNLAVAGNIVIVVHTVIVI